MGVIRQGPKLQGPFVFYLILKGGASQMPGFVQLNYHEEMTQNIVNDFKDRLKNPYYLFSSKKQTVCTYYNINMNESTFDPGIKTHYVNFGNESPLRFNKINKCFLYGISGGELNAALGDYGIESSEVGGDCFTLPNVFEPYPNDFFSINYLDRDLLFKVLAVTPERLDNGAVFWKIEYKLDQHSFAEGDIEDLVVQTQTMKVQNYGTNHKVLLTDEELQYEEDISESVTHLKTLYRDLFYDSDVQTFCFNEENGASFYDPYMIEFFIRHDIMAGVEENYIYVTHRTILSKYFNLEYDHSIFKAIETRRIDQVKGFNNIFCGIGVEEPTSLLSQHYHTYYQMTYDRYATITAIQSFTVFSTDLVEHILDNVLYEDNSKLIYNIIINYFNDTTSDISFVNKAIELMDFANNKETFYLVPFLIYILSNSIDT